MFQKIKKYAVVSLVGLTLLAPAVAPAMAYAACSTSIATSIASGAQAAGGDSGGGETGCSATNGVGTSVGKLAGTIVNIFSIVVGVVAVIMIIVGGFRYITSGGDSNRVGGAKNTLIYAIIGLVIVALAQLIVHYVLSTTSNAATSAAGSIYFLHSII